MEWVLASLVTGKGLSSKLPMIMKAYVSPMLTQRAFELFSVRDFLQEHLLKFNQPIVPPEVMLESDMLGNNTAPEVGRVEFETPAIKFEFQWERLRYLKSPVTGLDLEFKGEFGSISDDSHDTFVGSADGFEAGFGGIVDLTHPFVMPTA